MLRRGVSNVVVTILLVLLALGAVLILWGLVRTQLGQSESQIQLTKACFDLELEAVSCKYDTTNATTIRYKRGPGETGFELTKISLVIEFENGGSKVIQVEGSDVPDFLETKVHTTVSLDSVPKKVSVAGILLTQEGEEKTCGESPISAGCSLV